MKKILLLFFVSLSLLFFTTSTIQADGLVPCGQTPTNRCELKDLFQLITNVYDQVLILAGSFAGLMIVIGGMLILVSGGNSKFFDTGKKMIWGAIIGMILLWTAWLIIHTALWVIGVEPQFIP